MLLATSPAYAAGFFVREAKQLCVLRDAVAKDPTEQNILAYLRAFPDTFPKLVATAFQESMQTPTCSGQLHVRLLNEIFQMHPREVLAAELRASIGGVSIPDGPNLFQEAVGHHAATSAALFAGELLKLNAAERESVLEFLVDWEGGPTEDMRRLVVELRQLHFNALADSIELAMKVRGLRYDA